MVPVGGSFCEDKVAPPRGLHFTTHFFSITGLDVYLNRFLAQPLSSAKAGNFPFPDQRGN